MTNSTTVSHSYGDTFSVFDRVSKWHVGEITLMSGGWAAYTASMYGVVAEKRIGTYETAEDAIRAIGKTYKVEDLLKYKYADRT